MVSNSCTRVVRVRITRVEVNNFASYERLVFEFKDSGLVLISGPTGSGKSTLCDIIPWGLFGKTAKGGAVNEVVSWPGNKLCTADITLDTGHTIFRSRGSKPSDNDLIIISANGDATRGKDITDTQRLVNNLVGMDIELYLAGSYYNEFSQTAQFFTTTAKNRRVVCEQIVDLSLAKTMQTKLELKSKSYKKLLSKIKSDMIEHTTRIKVLESNSALSKNTIQQWERIKLGKLETLRSRSATFETDKMQAINTYMVAKEAYALKQKETPICSECGALKTIEHTDHYNPFDDKIEEARKKENTYDLQIGELLLEVNPYINAQEDTAYKINNYKYALSLEQDSERDCEQALADLEVLYEVSASYRSLTISTAIQGIEDRTNELLSKYFDSELKVLFLIEDNDKLEAQVTKDGNMCSYTQLSKGQRQLLKLCFGVGVMRQVAHSSGIEFNRIFMDESMDGLDESMKQRALRLLDSLTLEYDAVYLVEHSEGVKAMVDNQYNVRLADGKSQIEKA